MWGQCWCTVLSHGTGAGCPAGWIKGCWWLCDLQSHSSPGLCCVECHAIHRLSHLRSGGTQPGGPWVATNPRSGVGAHIHLRGPLLDELDLVPCVKSWLGQRHHLADRSCIEQKITSTISKKSEMIWKLLRYPMSNMLSLKTTW